MYWTDTSSHFSSIRVIFLGKLQTDTVRTLTSSTYLSLEPTCIIPAVLPLIKQDNGVISYLDLFRSFPFYFLFLADDFMSEELWNCRGCCACGLNVRNVNSKCGANNRSNEDECEVSLKCHSKTWILFRWSKRETDRVYVCVCVWVGWGGSFLGNESYLPRGMHSLKMQLESKSSICIGGKRS